MTTDLPQIQATLDEIDNRGRGLTDWEIEFLDQMLKLTDRGEIPSPKQVDIISRMRKERVR